MESFGELNLRTLLEMKRLREEALELYDYCLAEGNSQPLQRYIEEKLTQNPPPLLLLYEIADDIQQRMLSLQEHHYDVRTRVLSVMKNIYHTDISHLSSADHPEQYHQLSVDVVLNELDQQGCVVDANEEKLIRELLHGARETANQLQADIRLTRSLREMVLDWVNALAAQVARDYAHEFDHLPRLLH